MPLNLMELPEKNKQTKKNDKKTQKKQPFS